MSDAPNDLVCFNCGKALEKAATFCPHCGAPLPGQDSLIPVLWRGLRAATLFFLSLLFGAFGSCCFLVGTFMGAAIETALGGLIILAIGILLFQAAQAVWKRK